MDLCVACFFTALSGVKNELYVISKMLKNLTLLYNQVAILAYTKSIVSTTPADI